MMYESSKDYGDNTILIIFDGETPSRDEIINYVEKNYGDVNNPTIDIEEPSEYNGLKNDGCINVSL